MQLYGLDVSKPKDSQRIQVVVAAQRNQTKSFHSRPHAELNAILISRNLCHNYFLIISHSARPRCRISHCVRDGLKFNNKNAVKFLFVRFCLDFHRDSDSHSHSDSGCNLITLTTLSVFFWGWGEVRAKFPAQIIMSEMRDLTDLSQSKGCARKDEATRTSQKKLS